MLNDKRINSCLSRFDSGAYSRLQFLRAVSHSVGAHTESLQPPRDSSSSEDKDEDRRAPVPAATTSGASQSATAAAATILDDCSQVCLVAPRAGFALFYSAPKR